MADDTKQDHALEERETAAAEKAAQSSRSQSQAKQPDDWSMF